MFKVHGFDVGRLREMSQSEILDLAETVLKEALQDKYPGETSASDLGHLLCGYLACGIGLQYRNTMRAAAGDPKLLLYVLKRIREDSANA